MGRKINMKIDGNSTLKEILNKKTLRIVSLSIIICVFSSLFLVSDSFYKSNLKGDKSSSHYSSENKSTFANTKAIFPETIFELKLPEADIKNDISSIGVPILMYHNIDWWKDDSTELFKSLTIKPNDFDSQMLYLYDNGYTPITLKELNLIWNNKEQMPSKPIVLTFDDGYIGVYHYAYPILKKYKFKFVVFYITKFLNKYTLMYMSKNNLKEMLKSGLLEIGSHTIDHIDLAKATKEDVCFEISKSKSDIKKYLDYDATSFCYPDGSYNNFSIETLKKFNYSMAVATKVQGLAFPSQNHLLLKIYFL